MLETQRPRESSSVAPGALKTPSEPVSEPHHFLNQEQNPLRADPCEEADAAALPSPPSSAWLHLCLLLAAVTTTFVLLHRLAPTNTAPKKTAFERKHLRKLKELRPRHVFLGNSMLYTRLNEKLLNEEVSSGPSQLIASGGAASSSLYLMLKNYVVASNIHPARVTVFFRDRMLTQPHFRTHGKYQRIIQSYSHANEPVLQQILSRTPPGALARLGASVERWLPDKRWRASVEQPIEDFSTWLSSRWDPRNGTKRRMKRINKLFKVENLRSDPTDDVSRTTPDSGEAFQNALSGSFLPPFVKLAKQHHVPLLFVRVKRRRVAEGRPDTNKLRTYLEGLQSYLQEHQIPFKDLTKTNWNAAALYGSGDHIAKKHRDAYTKHFIRHVPEAFP